MDEQNNQFDAQAAAPETAGTGRRRSAASKKKRAARRRMETRARVVAIGAAVLAGAFFVINLITPNKETSENENRSLAQWPGFSVTALADGSWSDGVSDWYADQFFARDGWISLNLKMEKLLGRKESNDVFLCSGGRLIGNPEKADESVVESTSEAINSFAEAYPDIDMNVMVVPGAACIQPDFLPAHAPAEDQITDIETAEAKLNASVGVIDAAAALEPHSDEYIYYLTDHHWTSLGAYYAFLAAAPQLGIDNVVDYTVYTVTDSFEGTLASESGSHKAQDTIDIYAYNDSDILYYVSDPDAGTNVCSVYDSSALDTKDKYTVFFGGNHALLRISTTANNGRCLLIFKDSYANSFVQFLLPYYEGIVMVDPRYYYDDISTLISSDGITDVLFLYSGDYYLTDGSLSDTLSMAY